MFRYIKKLLKIIDEAMIKKYPLDIKLLDSGEF